MNAVTRAEAGDDQAQSHVISADLGEADASKAVVRQPIGLPASEDSDEELPPHLRNSREVRRRLKRLAGKFNQQLAEQEARHQREISGLRDQVDRIGVSRGDASTGDAAEHERKMKALEDEVAEAQERGDSKKIAELMRKMSEESAAFMQAQTQKMLGQGQGQGQGQGDRATARQAAGDADADRPAAKPAVSTEGQRWINAQDDWWDEDDYSPERAAVVAIHEQLKQEGSDPESRGHYAELERRAAKKFPNLPIVRAAGRRARDDGDGEGDGERRPSRELLQPHGDGAPFNPQPAGGVSPRRQMATLTPQQRKTMLETGQLDPNNDKHVLIYLREANALAQQEER